jgi:hypothetical protein
MDWMMMLKLWGKQTGKLSQEQRNLTGSSKEGSSPKMDALPMMTIIMFIIMIMIIIMHHNYHIASTIAVYILANDVCYK